MSLKRATQHDKRGLIAESYHIDELDQDGARAIFLDWALMDAGDDPFESMKELWELHGALKPDHPMSILLRQGIDKQNVSKTIGRKRRPR